MRRIVPALLAIMLFSPARAAELFRDCPRCPELVAVPAGTFVMGSDKGEKYERPAHPVTIAKPFAIGRYEVTFDEWAYCVEEKGCHEVPDDHFWGFGNRPVINLTFDDMVRYTRWLGRRTGRNYRLPSEAEWEYAARAGTTTEYWWGDEVGQGKANCRECGTEWSGKMSAPVGSLAANPWGLHDTSGNVWEWVADCWVPSHVGAPADGSARTAGDCGNRVTRGGSWYYFPKLSRSAYRYKNDVRIKSYNIGFRVLRELP
jgi:formylglycine-generating enzyme required for sulfatase activity